MANRSGPSGERRSRTRFGQRPTVFGVDSHSSKSSTPDREVIDLDLNDKKYKGGMPIHLRYDWTGVNPRHWYVCCCEIDGIKCASFRSIDSEWDIRTLIVIEKLMEMKGKVEEEVRSWKEACTIAKEEANAKGVGLKTMTRYYEEATNSLFETTKKIRNDTLLSELGMGNHNRYLKAENDVTMWKEECAKANKKIKETVSELQTVKGHLDSALIVVKKVKELPLEASYKRSLKDNNEA